VVILDVNFKPMRHLLVSDGNIAFPTIPELVDWILTLIDEIFPIKLFIELKDRSCQYLVFVELVHIPSTYGR